MADNDAVEITIVLKDGTVLRWEGEAARRFYLNASLSDTSWCDNRERPTVTKPLRKVTEFSGYRALGHELLGGAPGSVEVLNIDTVLPDGIAFGSGDHRFRFSVEAEPVEEKDR